MAKKALSLFKPGKYDLVLMDIGLEETSGYVVAKQLRKKEEKTKHHVPIIALTGFSAEVIRTIAVNALWKGYLPNPNT